MGRTGWCRIFEYLDNRNIHDVFIIAARSIEQSLQACGARPGNDYTLLDLYQLAMPFALERFKEAGTAVNFSE
jgi:hypothetical protein